LNCGKIESFVFVRALAASAAKSGGEVRANFFRKSNPVRFISTASSMHARPRRRLVVVQAGQFLERADKTRAFWTCVIKRWPNAACQQLSSPDNALEWTACALVQRVDAYKTIYGADVHPRLVAEFLLLSDNFRARCVLRED